MTEEYANEINEVEKLYFLALAAIVVTIAVQSYIWNKRTNKSLRQALENRLMQWRQWTSWRTRIIEEEHTAQSPQGLD